MADIKEADDDTNWWEDELEEYQQETKVRAENIFDAKSAGTATTNMQPLSLQPELDLMSQPPMSMPPSPMGGAPETFEDMEMPSDDEEMKSLSNLGEDDVDDKEEARKIDPSRFSHRRMSHEEANFEVIQTPEHFYNALTRMTEEIVRMSNQKFVTEDTKHALAEVKDALEKVTSILEEEDKKDTKNDADVLLNFDHLPWHFENPNVAAYRARAYHFPHDQFLQQDLHVPRYFSGGVLPKNTPDSLQCNVVVTHSNRPQQLTMTLTNHDTASSLISKVYDHYESRAEAIRILGDPSSNVLKMVGLDEYMHGSEILFSYETIRTCLRNLSSIDLALVKRPEFKALLEYCERHNEIYKSRVDFTLPLLTLDDFTETRMSSGVQWDQQTFIPLRSLNQEFRYRIRGIENVNEAILPRLDPAISHVKVRVFLFHGTEIIKHSDMSTPDVPRSQSPRWSQWLSPSDGEPALMASKIPREARISVLLYGRRPYAKEEDLLCWVNIPLIDQFGHVRSGLVSLKMWTIDAEIKDKHLEEMTFVFRGSTCENLTRSPNVHPVSVFIEFEQRALPVTAPIIELFREPDIATVGEKQLWKKLPKEVRQNLNTLIKMDPLYVLTAHDKEIFWMTRHHLLPYPLALPKFLQSVDWTSVDHRNEAHRLLSNWGPPLNPVSALELLDARFADYKVREYAVNCLRVLPDDELQLFLLQLAQTIKNEPYHDSPLTRFLIERALRNPLSIGHSLFWHLKAELHEPFHCERFALILEEYLFHAGTHASDLRKQYDLVQRLQRISGRVVARKHAKDIPDDEIQAEYVAALHKLNENFLEKSGSIQIPLNPKWLVTTLVVEKCRFMSSKMAPLWLVFKNADPLGDNIIVMFKSGDDLRQDILILQLLKVMDKIWVSEDLDMRLIPYNCVSTGVNAQGKGVGLIEIVLNSDTTSGIQLKYGGGAMGAFKLDPLQKFIQDHNKEEKQYEAARDTFIKSCAGYCVATYVLGIGDRHNGNIMLTKDGHLFHIDFGHFLGNFKSKLGFKRERAAFVLTPEMAFVMGGKNYKKAKEFRVFTDLSAQAFTILRNHASLFINLFSMMVSAQMPELMFQDDINYLRDKFFLQDTEKGAVERLRKEIQKSLSSTYRQVDNLLHNIKHG